MLAVARNLDVATSDLAAMRTQQHNWLELLIRLFAKRQFTHLLVRPDLVASRFDELSENTPLNRVCRAAAKRLTGITRSLENHRRLM